MIRRDEKGIVRPAYVALRFSAAESRVRAEGGQVVHLAAQARAEG